MIFLSLIFTILFFSGCGDVPPENSETTFISDEYILISPSQPPFIQFLDSNIGIPDDIEVEENIEFPTTPIPMIPEIIE